LPNQVVDVNYIDLFKACEINFGVVRMLCLIGEPTLPESETNQSVLC